MLFLYRGKILYYQNSAEDRENTNAVEAEDFSEEVCGISRRGKEKYGRYFGICSSYHHLKACVCKTCPSYSGGAGMFCARGGIEGGKRRKEGCLCETCELFKKFQLEGDYFCYSESKGEAFEKKQPSRNICSDFRTSAGTIRVCVLDDKSK